MDRRGPSRVRALRASASVPAGVHRVAVRRRGPRERRNRAGPRRRPRVLDGASDRAGAGRRPAPVRRAAPDDAGGGRGQLREDRARRYRPFGLAVGARFVGRTAVATTVADRTAVATNVADRTAVATNVVGTNVVDRTAVDRTVLDRTVLDNEVGQQAALRV